ncbi:MAG: ATP-binding cassette domain-containing protein [Actinocrinis sp.]
MNAVNAVDLVKTYENGVEAVRGISLAIAAGSVFGLLGVHGAGKSTVVRLLTTMSTPTSGTATVAGHDIVREPAAVRRAVGCVTRESRVDVHETGRENLLLRGQLHGIRDRELHLQAAELLHRFGLSNAADRLVKSYSAVMMRKLDIALALIHEPSVLVLDEPAAGLGPEEGAELGDQIRELVWDRGLTVLFATRCLEAALGAAHRLAVVDEGRIVLEGTPDELRSALHGDPLTLAPGPVPPVLRRRRRELIKCV